MGVRIIADPDAISDGAALYDSVTGAAFGPVFANYEEAEEFLNWADTDLRELTHQQIVELRQRWRDESEEEEA